MNIKGQKQVKNTKYKTGKLRGLLMVELDFITYKNLF
jgi:hypothetical protein